jgi:hypothetical protein
MQDILVRCQPLQAAPFTAAHVQQWLAQPTLMAAQFLRDVHAMLATQDQ